MLNLADATNQFIPNSGIINLVSDVDNGTKDNEIAENGNTTYSVDMNSDQSFVVHKNIVRILLFFSEFYLLFRKRKWMKIF
jgi:hypothetical protein